MEKSKMICENCRFKFEHESYHGLRCARLAPRCQAGVVTDFKDDVWVGVRVARQFYCFQGEWYDEEREKFFSLWDF